MSEINVLDKAASLAISSLEKIKAPAKEEVAVEPKAATEKVDLEEKAKDLNAVEKSAKEDERILSADEKTLSESEAKRKTELLETKKEKAKSPEDKIKRAEEASQRRIDEIKSELLAEQNKRKQDAEAIEKLKEELAIVKKTIQPKVDLDEKTRLKQLETERINKYVEEDKVRPRENRREMSKESLEEWYLEDPVEATAWMQERTLRRVEERKQFTEGENKETAKKLADDFIAKQSESKEKLFAKFPGVNPSKEKIASFAGLKGKELVDALCEDNEEFKICTEIVSANPKWIQLTNGPELVLAEMEKRLSGKTSGNGKITLTEEELEAKIQAEAERRASLDEGISSTKGKKMEQKTVKTSEQRQNLERIAKKAGIPMDSLDKTIERRRGIPGAGTFKDDND